MMGIKILACLFLVSWMRVDMFVASRAEAQKLLLILLDGFRWDYVEKENLFNFKRLYSVGARAGYMINDFPTVSYPNYYSLMTGLHTESHGMTGNYMYDKSRQEAFLLGKNPEHLHAHWWNGGEPLWVTAVRQAKTAYMYHWPGCEVNIHNRTPTFCEKYMSVTTSDDFKADLARSMELLTDGTGDFAGVYHEAADYFGHGYGPDSEELSATVRSIDKELGNLLDKLQENKANNMINVVLVSDHGMTSIARSRLINITDVLNDTGSFVTIMGSGAVVSIYTSSIVQENQVYNLLKEFHPKMKVFRRSDIPDRLHYKHGKYVGDVTCLADFGWYIVHPLKKDFPQKDKKDISGAHGFDNREQDMRGIFFAVGPYFKPGSQVGSLKVVDPYNILCDILDISPAPNNGTRATMQPLLATSASRDVDKSQLLFIISAFSSLAFMFLKTSF